MSSPSRNPDPASFRDPAGQVFRLDGKLHRSVRTAAGLADFARLEASGLGRRLVASGQLVAYTPVAALSGADEQVLALDELPFISYPYEWCFGQLRDAALLTLDLAAKALAADLLLKDASAFNVAWNGRQPVFIDHGSFTCYQEGEAWSAYRQFARHFLAPLLLMSRCDQRLGCLNRLDLDGIPLDLASSLLPWPTWLSPGALIHLHLHARWENRYADSKSAASGRRRQVSRLSLQALFSSLHHLVASLRLPPRQTTWSDYYDDTNYSAAAFAAKQELVERLCAAHPAPLAVDFGANTGLFSRIAARSCRTVVAADFDFGAIEKLYARVRAGDGEALLPVVQDLNVPTPELGIGGCERMSFRQRIDGCLALGLALLHHLRISGNWPVDRIIAFFAAIAPVAILEFVPRDDSQVVRLLRSRPDLYADWTLAHLLEHAARHYRQVETFPLADSGRILILLRK